MAGWAGSIKLADSLSSACVPVVSALRVRRVATATWMWEMVLHRRGPAAIINAA